MMKIIVFLFMQIHFDFCNVIEYLKITVFYSGNKTISQAFVFEGS